MKHMCSAFLVCAALLCGSWCMAQVAVTTYHNDNYRSGSNPNETQLNPHNVTSQTFGKVAVYQVTGQVYAQPLYVPGVNIGGTSHNVVFIATEHDQVYAYDVNSGNLLWHTSFLGSPNSQIIVSPISSDDVGCPDMTPEIGISGTPAIDTATNTIYMVAIYQAIQCANPSHHLLSDFVWSRLSRMVPKESRPALSRRRRLALAAARSAGF